MSDIHFKAEKHDELLLAQASSITFHASGQDSGNWARINADGSFDHGDAYDPDPIAIGVAVALVQQSGGDIEADVDECRGFTIKPNGQVEFRNWLPSPKAAAFIDTLASRYAEVSAEFRESLR